MFWCSLFSNRPLGLDGNPHGLFLKGAFTGVLLLDFTLPLPSAPDGNKGCFHPFVCSFLYVEVCARVRFCGVLLASTSHWDPRLTARFLPLGSKLSPPLLFLLMSLLSRRFFSILAMAHCHRPLLRVAIFFRALAAELTNPTPCEPDHSFLPLFPLSRQPL